MSQSSDRGPGERLAIVAEVGAELDRLFHEAEDREAARPRRGVLHRRLSVRRWRPLALLAVLVLGGGSGALAAAGVFQTGTPVGASVLAKPRAFEGVAIPGTVHLLSLRVPDPGGGPPWALRSLRTTRGLECVQLGRLVDRRLGVLGQDGAFRNDGRFHPLSANAFEYTFNCGTLDARGHAFAVDNAYGVATSGLVANTGDGGCAIARTPPRGVRVRRPSIPVCPPGSLRDIYFGMLGPDARSVTYDVPGGGTATVPTAGPDGAFLIVYKTSGGLSGESGGPTLTDYPANAFSRANPIRAVAYTGGRRCALPGPKQLARREAADSERYKVGVRARFPALAKLIFRSGPLSGTERTTARRIQQSASYRAWARTQRDLLGLPPSCPTYGYVAPALPRLTHADVATPITVHTQIAKSLCTNDIEITVPCGAVVPAGYRRNRAILAKTNLLVTLTWTTRIAIPNQDSHYEIALGATATAGRYHCGTGTGAGPTETDYEAGARVTYTTWMPLRCPGIAHGNVAFVRDTGPAGSIPVPYQPGEGPDIPVGSFTVKVP